MNTFDDDTQLRDGLYRIGATAPVPLADPAEDVRRGRRRVRRARLVATVGTVMAVGIIGIAGVALQPGIADRATDPAGSPAATSTSSVRRAESVAQALPSAFDLAINVMFERDGALAGVPDVVMRPLRATTDETITAWTAKAEQIDAGGDQELADVLARIQRSLDGMATTRSDIRDTTRTQVAAAAYGTLADDLFSLARLVPSVGDAEIDAQIEALGAIRPAFRSLGEERAIMMEALTKRQYSQTTGMSAEPISEGDLAALASAEATWRRSLADFYTATSERQRETLDRITFNTATDGAIGVPAHRAVNQILSTGSLDRVTLTPDAYTGSYTELIRGLQKLFVAAASEIIDDLAALDR
ncbi:nitrate- and nitrite sensing domain-containing protein [Nocardioides sp. NPDC057772]|uniref:nitrate- and nitrite sensing domain-containing protein n=1 Tax=Nocardioides sp. NPDC057772 TaxID=3346245 RepID=UPI00366EC1C8